MHLDWPGCRNARRLNFITPEGVTRDLIRSDHVDEVDDELLAEVTTILDLRNADERRKARTRALHLPLDGVEDREFWQVWGQRWEFGTPLYYLPHLERMPERSARVLQAMAESPPGTVLFHCAIGRDRTGMIAMLLLSHLGVSAEAIVDDYMHSIPRLPPQDVPLTREMVHEVAQEISNKILLDPARLKARFLRNKH
ncbi:MAG: tyrosine-protein phosphatase [Candidatus Eremiobacteraeota bacterium]|mgnify:CR=1 FL=1|nr:tyrosine-protein phosphatase [Candidatus Eremiobacteraeota bacterium]